MTPTLLTSTQIHEESEEGGHSPEVDRTVSDYRREGVHCDHPEVWWGTLDKHLDTVGTGVTGVMLWCHFRCTMHWLAPVAVLH